MREPPADVSNCVLVFWSCRNKKELEDYLRGALDRISILEFTLDHATWDERRGELNVVYEANLNGERKCACEIMQFDATGRQIRGEAFYGVAIWSGTLCESIAAAGPLKLLALTGDIDTPAANDRAGSSEAGMRSTSPNLEPNRWCQAKPTAGR